MTITALPTPPTRADATNFSTRADAFMAALPTFVAEANADSLAIAANATLASSSAANAAASANAAIWVSGTTYAIGDVRWSPATRYTYRRITAGAGTTDPSNDATNWALAGTMLLSLVISTSTANAMVANQHLVLTNAAASTATLPAAPVAGDQVQITVANGRADNVVARNGQNIMSLAENLTLDNGSNATVTLRFINATIGWRLV